MVHILGTNSNLEQATDLELKKGQQSYPVF